MELVKITMKWLLFPVMLLVLAGCDRSGLDKKVWQYTGSDQKRGIDHYYSKPSVKKIAEGLFTVTTKGVSKKGNKAVEEATNVKNARAFDVKMELGCKDKYVKVLSKEYLDADGIALLVEKEEGAKMDAVRPITVDMPIYRMYQDLCR